jgi:dTDP-D-glucose 4,6-dehydratase
MFFLELINTKAKISNFYNIKKKHDSDSIILENIISSFSHKVEKDTNSLGYIKYVGNDMNYLINEINHSNLQIYKSLDFLKAKQNNISRFIVKLNKHLFEKKKENENL